MVPPRNNQVKHRTISTSLIEYIDTHPRSGWYIAVLAVLNTIFNIIELFT